MSESSQFVAGEDYNYYKGVRYPRLVTEKVFDAMKTLEVRQDDIWLLTYPKAGNVVIHFR